MQIVQLLVTSYYKFLLCVVAREFLLLLAVTVASFLISLWHI
jgi:hypothetical protein